MATYCTLSSQQSNYSCVLIVWRDSHSCQVHDCTPQWAAHLSYLYHLYIAAPRAVELTVIEDDFSLPLAFFAALFVSGSHLPQFSQARVPGSACMHSWQVAIAISVCKSAIHKIRTAYIQPMGSGMRRHNRILCSYVHRAMLTIHVYFTWLTYHNKFAHSCTIYVGLTQACSNYAVLIQRLANVLSSLATQYDRWKEH